MKTFNNTLETYEAWHGAISRHLALDALAQSEDEKVIVQGLYWEGNGMGKGCHVGCTLHDFAKKHDVNTNDHSAFESLFGIPQTLARLFDCIHEGLKADDTADFLAAVRDTIKPDMDLGMVWPKLALWLLADETNPYRLNQHESVAEVINQVANVYRTWIEAGKPDLDAAQAAQAAAAQAAAAQAAAARAADARADAADAAYAAQAAAAQAAYARAAAARAADAADAAYAAQAAYAQAAYARAADFWPAVRDKLISLIAECGNAS